MSVLKALLALAIVTLPQSTAEECFPGDVQLKPADDPIKASRVVQYCHQGMWRSICRNASWAQVEANTVCNQLGHSNKGALASNKCEQPDRNGYLILKCDGSEASLNECSKFPDTTCNRNCSNGNSKGKRHSTVRCLPANCDNGAVRLVGGSIIREGRVEVCVDGHWGTVCNNSQEGIAEAVCSQLGFPGEGAVAIRNQFGRGAMLAYDCTLSENKTLDCSLTNNVSCDHTTSLGVVCRTHSEIIKAEINRTIDETLQACTSTDTTSTATGVEGGMIDQDSVMSSTAALGGVVGVLVALLVILVIGWSLSCVVLVKRNSNTQKQTQVKLSSNSDESTDQRHWDNPVYDTNMESHNYSSGGPTYELMDTNEGVGPTYSIQGQARENAYSNGAASTQDEEHNYHVLESGECEGVTGGGCDYEVPVSQQTHSRVMLCEEEYSTLKH